MDIDIKYRHTALLSYNHVSKKIIMSATSLVKQYKVQQMLIIIYIQKKIDMMIVMCYINNY